MGHVPMTRRVRRMLEVLPGAIMVATVVPLIVARRRAVALIAVAVALASMILRRNEFLAVGLGLAFARAGRATGCSLSMTAC